MNTGKTLFAQVMEFLPLHEFRHCVRRYQGHYTTKRFSCVDQFLCMSVAQMTYRESLRDLETCLRSMHSKRYHMGIRGKVSRSTLADANETRDWRIYADFAHILIHRARALYRDEDFGLELDQTVYALDATTIDLCLSLFPWARFRRQKGALKLHTLLDLRGPIPAFIEITDGNVHDVKLLALRVPEPGAFYVMDRGYLDFARLHHRHRAQAFFVIRAKGNLQARRLYSHPIDKTTGLQCDQTVLLTGPLTAQDDPDTLRRVRSFDAQLHKRRVFLTNQFALPPLTIAQLYKSRWQVELFFKWIKQHLRIKAFYGTSENAVKTQRWIAIATYVLIAIIRKQLGLTSSLYTFLQIVSVTAFEKTPRLRACLAMPEQKPTDQNPNQRMLFEL
ncbi:MAG: IS4 family transposase [Candidatus Omnitrophica bacterium]|nr:IS4 family transposase [Candidatus Omnitrophota bacterium]